MPPHKYKDTLKFNFFINAIEDVYVILAENGNVISSKFYIFVVDGWSDNVHSALRICNEWVFLVNDTVEQALCAQEMANTTVTNYILQVIN